MSFVNKEGEFTGCHCGNCADAMVSAIKVFDEALQMNDNCTVWALMLADAMNTVAKATFVSMGVNIAAADGHHPAIGLNMSLDHVAMLQKAMNKTITSDEGTKAVHAIIGRMLGMKEGDAYTTLEDVFKPKRT